jgi:UDP-N-acetyl-D-mannosaminuronate dehydrogenase
MLEATSDFIRLSEADAILICVPTPLGPHKEPDLQYVESSAHAIQKTLRPGQLVILESTTYPGTTDDLLKPILESPCHPERSAPKGREVEGPPESQSGSKNTGGVDGKSEFRIPKSEISEGSGGNSEFRIPNSELNCGTDFFLAFSPEREDPGNPSFGTTNTPKVVGGVDETSGDLAQALYDQIVDSTVRVASARIAEAAKLTENIFRSVNIALVNELKIIYDRLGIDIWDVLDAAETKPFGFMRFNPGPGLGGHCILGSEWLRIRGCGLAGVYRAADLFGVIARRFPAAVTRNGIFVEPKGLEALALDTGSGEVDWFPVTTLYRGRYEGRGVRFSIDAANDLTVTNEHPMLVHRDHVFETVSAQNVNAGDRLPVVQEDQSSGMVDRTAQVAKAETVQISDWVYSMEVPEANTFVTSSGIAVHNCIPLDPFYLAWRAREAGVPTRFIELAGEINTSMPGYVIEKLQAALNERGKAVKGAKVLILGLAYKPDIDDPRESPAFEIIDRLLALGAEISYHDPHIPIAPKMRSWPGLPRMTSVELTPEALAAADAVLLVTNHEKVDYDLVLEHAPLIIDTRGVYRGRGGMVRPA